MHFMLSCQHSAEGSAVYNSDRNIMSCELIQSLNNSMQLTVFDAFLI
jgi:hypothetical protein